MFGINKKLVSIFCLTLAALWSVPEDAFGQRRSGGSSSRSSTPKRTTTQKSTKQKSNSGWGQKKSTTKKDSNKATKPSSSDSNKKSSWGSNKGSSQSRNKMTKKQAADKTAAEKALHDKAKKNGTHYKSRAEATSAFKAKHQADIDKKYPSKFDSKPTTRPDYIPQTTSVGGNTYNVTYNQQYGGYGYMGASGWSMFDVMTVAIVADAMFSSHSYAYGQPRVYHATSSGGSATLIIILSCIIVVIIGIAVFFIVSARSETSNTGAA